MRLTAGGRKIFTNSYVQNQLGKTDVKQLDRKSLGVLEDTKVNVGQEDDLATKQRVVPRAALGKTLPAAGGRWQSCLLGTVHRSGFPVSVTNILGRDLQCPFTSPPLPERFLRSEWDAVLTWCCACNRSNTCRDSAVPGLSLGTVRLLPSSTTQQWNPPSQPLPSTWRASWALPACPMCCCSCPRPDGPGELLLHFEMGLPCRSQMCWHSWLHQQPAFLHTVLCALQGWPWPRASLHIHSGVTWTTALSVHAGDQFGKEERPAPL